MEQHAIPRDVTGFKFKLVGSMTLKQFGYVAGGAIIGYLCFKAPLGILSLPLTGIFWFLGFALAFIPIQERPLDRWIIAFIKSVYSPTQFIWKKTPPEIKILAPAVVPKKTKRAPLSQYLDSRKKLDNYLKSLPLPLEQELDQREAEVLSRALSFFQESPLPAPPSKSSALKKSPPPSQFPPPPQKMTGLSPQKPKPIIPLPLKIKAEEKAPSTVKPIVEENGLLRERRLEGKIKTLKKDLEIKNLSRGRFLEISQQLTKALEEKRRLEQELGNLRKKVQQKEKGAVEPKDMVEEDDKPRVKIVTPKLAPKSGIPHIPQAANIISGIIKDSLGRLLSGIIVTVKDKNEMTVRALKTNTAGLFVSATPLSSGAYILELEDPQKKFEFDIIKVNLKGEVYSPLEILAKGEREQAREQLTKELFGYN
ncbi:PrgI family protein [Candidatus Microgenomates bacterium]|nr:PrgI family protein [Candidatus Microgenomates bacterium]